jgi:hypothetical protein
MRSAAFMISVVSVALLSLLGWVRHESHRLSGSALKPHPGEDESILFVG